MTKNQVESTAYMTNHATLPKVFVFLLTTIEALYQTSVSLEGQNHKNVQLATHDLPNYCLLFVGHSSS